MSLSVARATDEIEAKSESGRDESPELLQQEQFRILHVLDHAVPLRVGRENCSDAIDGGVVVPHLPPHVEPLVGRLYREQVAVNATDE